MAAQSVENQDLLELPLAETVSANAIVVVVEDPYGTPTPKVVTLMSLVAGGGSSSSGSGPPPAPPPDPTHIAFYVDEDTDSLVYWNVSHLEWRVLLGNLEL